MGAQRFGVVYGYLAPREDGGYILAADHDRILAEAEARGWNAGLSGLDKQLAKAMELLDGDPAVIGLRKARLAIAALRKPEVEG